MPDLQTTDGSNYGPARLSDREDLLSRYQDARAATQRLCEGLNPEDCAIQSMPDASPAKWHLAHTTWFFENFVIAAAGRPKCSPPEYNYLFNSYYNSVGAMHQRDRRGMLSRPALNEILAYRAAADREMCSVIESSDQERWQRLAPVIVLGINHEQQHQELILTDIKHLFAQNPLRPAYRRCAISTAGASKIQALQWHRFAPGIYWIGHREENGFCFDNELPRHRELIPGVALGSRLVTNAEYRAFIDDGGYRRPELWLAAGWDTAQREGWTAPLYWERKGEDWWSFELCGMRPVEDCAPVCHVSYFEADAYARWADARLPTEAEWEIATVNLSLSGNFAESGSFRPLPCDGAPALRQMFGDAWEWTSSSYAPYPGYRAAAGALGEYNGKFMCNQYVLRGGSCATPQSHIRATYRNFFAPEKRWQFTGIRLARDL
jgi:ergothioneine biosynthesis protein EgtB